MGAWKLTVWGVRGSSPVPDAAFLGRGGNTSCFSLECGDAFAVLDAGSGLAGLGARLVREERRRADILLSHTHLDHIMGLFSFPMLHDPAAEVHLYGAPGMMKELPCLIGPPLWPVSLTACRAKVELHELSIEKTFRLEGTPALSVKCLKGCHPGGCVYYRLEENGRSLVYALDCELAGDMEKRLTAFAQGADLLIWDAGFAPGEQIAGWGHSTWEQGLSIGREAGVKQVLMSHFGPGHTDEFLQEQERLAGSSAGPLVRFAREGMVLSL